MNVFGSHKESTAIRRDDCVFCLEVAICGLKAHCFNNQELIENHFILPYYDGEKICNWKEL